MTLQQKRYFCLIILLMVSLIISACGSLLSKEPTPIPATDTPLPTATHTPQPTSTPTPLPPMIHVSDPAECYSGPGIPYELVTVIEAGTNVEVVGRETGETFWVVSNPNGESETCWLDSANISIEGETGELAIVQPPATPLPPPAPEYFYLEGFCDRAAAGPARNSGGLKPYPINLALFWEDVEGELGYRLYKNYQLLVILDANTSNYADSDSQKGSGYFLVKYEIEAFNHSGSSERVEIFDSILCPP